MVVVTRRCVYSDFLLGVLAICFQNCLSEHLFNAIKTDIKGTKMFSRTDKGIPAKRWKA